VMLSIKDFLDRASWGQDGILQLCGVCDEWQATDQVCRSMRNTITMVEDIYYHVLSDGDAELAVVHLLKGFLYQNYTDFWIGLRGLCTNATLNHIFCIVIHTLLLCKSFRYMLCQHLHFTVVNRLFHQPNAFGGPAHADHMGGGPLPVGKSLISHHESEIKRITDQVENMLMQQPQVTQ
jgi:hypothetical protein